MNEIDLKTKIEGLEKAIKEHEDFAGNFKDSLKNPDISVLKQLFHCDTLLRKQGMLYFCRLIEEIEFEDITN